MASKPILVAEDNPINARVIEAHLSTGGFVAEIAVDGEQATSLAAHFAYDIILMDLNMPKMNGIDATKAVRQLSGPSQQAAIIGLSAEDCDTVRRNCLAAGMDDYIVKPVPRERLLAVLGVYLQRPRLAAR